MEILNTVTKIIILFLSICVSYQTFYMIVGILFKAKKYPETDIKKKYGVIIAARNEEKVIANLIKSLKNQTYPQEYITIFVVADNCTDKTAEIARENGAVVYERFDDTKRRKGWALEFLFEQIEKDYGIESFDAYCFFDADNVVSSTFIYEANKAFVSGSEALITYRNAKNFDTNFISAAYGMHSHKSCAVAHRPRNLLHTSDYVTGPGFCASSKILKNGWHYHLLTEDSQFSMENAIRGGKVDYCEAAQTYDESPTDFITAWRQRIRWTRGRLICYFKYHWKLLKGIFTLPWKKKWACFDMLFYIFPYALVVWAIGLIYPITSGIITLINHQPLPWQTWLSSVGIAILTTYIYSFITGILVLIREHKYIKCSVKKQILYLFTWPWFELINIPLLVCSLFFNAKWTQIVHKDERQIGDLEKQ